MKITVACAAGMSTSMLVKRIREAAEKKGIELEIDAHSVGALEAHAPGSDIILLGPQVGYQKDAIASDWPGIPVVVIDMMDYGMMNGEKVLDTALELIKNNK